MSRFTRIRAEGARPQTVYVLGNRYCGGRLWHRVVSEDANKIIARCGRVLPVSLRTAHDPPNRICSSCRKAPRTQ